MNQVNDHVEDDQPWAALLTSWTEGIFGWRTVVYPAKPEQYVQHVAEDLASMSISDVEHNRDSIDFAGYTMVQLYELFGGDNCPADGGTYEDVLVLLQRLPIIAAEEYDKSQCPAVETSEWYQELICNLNSLFPNDDGTWIDLEGPLESFLPKLLAFEVSGFQEITRLSDSEARWLGRMEILSRLSWQNTIPREQQRALDELLSEFNDRNREIYSLA